MRHFIHRAWRRTLGSVAVIAAVSTVFGCESDYERTGAGLKPKPAVSFAETASVHLAVVSAMPWDDVSASLQPKFELNPTQALAMVAPVTAYTDERLKEAFKLGIQLGYGDVPGAPTTKPFDPPAKPAVTEAAAATANADAATAAAPASVVPAPGVDAMLRYWAATALYQEVQIINRYVEMATLNDDYDAFVVRLQFTVMPNYRGRPYDLYSNVGFFAGAFDDAVGTKISKAGDGNDAARTEKALDWIAELYKRDDLKPNAAEAVASQAAPEVQVIPLLVTDNIESAIASRSAERLQEYALWLGAAFSSVSGAVDAKSVRQEIESILARDLNSTLTVGRLNDSAVRVRFGAQSQASSRFAMVPQSRYVTLLVMVSKRRGTEANTVRIVSKYELVDVVTSKVLRDRSGQEAAAAANQIIKSALVPSDLDRKTRAFRLEQLNERFMKLIRERVADADYAGFLALVVKIHPTITFPESLYMSLLDERRKNTVATASFPLPPDRTPNFPTGAVAYAFDDGKKTNVVVAGGKNLIVRKIDASLTRPSDNTTFAPLAVTSEANGNQIVLSFPSFKALGLTVKPGVVDDLKLALESSPGAAQAASLDIAYVFTGPLEAQVVATLKTLATRVVPSGPQNEAAVRLLVTFDKGQEQPCVLEVVGPEVIVGLADDAEGNPTATPLPAFSGYPKIEASGGVTLQLRNLEPSTPARIRLRPIKDGKLADAIAEVEIPVVAASR